MLLALALSAPFLGAFASLGFLAHVTKKVALNLLELGLENCSFYNL
jgi:hypothetical protein